MQSFFTIYFILRDIKRGQFTLTQCEDINFCILTIELNIFSDEIVTIDDKTRIIKEELLYFSKNITGYLIQLYPDETDGMTQRKTWQIHDNEPYKRL